MAEIYKIGIEIALIGSLRQGLEAISSQLLGINSKVKEVEGGFKRWGLAVGGVASLVAGGALFKGMEDMVSAGGELVKQQTLLLANMGVTHAEVLETTAKAQLATHQVIGTTIAENVKGIRELMGVMPNLKEAQNAFPAVMQGAKVLESMTGAPADQTMQVLAKAIELRGGGINPQTHELDPARFASETEAAVKAIIASGGLVNAQRLLMTMQQAGPMAKSVDNADTFYKGILTAMMDMGGFRAGTALTALGRQLLGGKMTKPTAEEMQDMGLLIPGMWHKSGVGVFVDKGGLKGEDILKDPNQGITAWMNDVLIPAFAAKGITKNADVQQELYRVFGTETARRIAGLYIQNNAQVRRDASLYDNALGGQAYGNVAGGDLGANVTNLKDAVTSFMQAFGAPTVPIAVTALQSLSGAMNSLAAIALAHPEAMKIVAEGLVGLSAGLAAMGTAAVIGAAAAFIPGGAIGIALIGLGGAIATIAAMNWQGATSAITGIKDAIASLIGVLSSAASSLKTLGTGGAGAAPDPGAAGRRDLFQKLNPTGGLQKQGFNEGGGQTMPMHIRTAVYLDGRVIGETMSSELARLSTYPGQAPQGDSYASWVAPDYSFATS